jgi:hypothetical protein
MTKIFSFLSILIIFISCGEINNRITKLKIVGKWNCNIAESLQKLDEMKANKEFKNEVIEYQATLMMMGFHFF